MSEMEESLVQPKDNPLHVMLLWPRK
jgi:hypothetical protein